MKIGIRKLVRKEQRIQPREELAPGKAIPCGWGGDPLAEA
jgi:hypothetical protein